MLCEMHTVVQKCSFQITSGRVPIWGITAPPPKKRFRAFSPLLLYFVLNYAVYSKLFSNKKNIWELD